MAGAYKILQIVLWFISASQVALGVAIMSSTGLQRAVAEAYGVSVPLDPQLSYILRPLGAFMIAMGLVCAAAALRPLRYRPIIFVFSGLLFARVVQRILFRREIEDIFGVGEERLMATGVFFGVLAVGLIVLMAMVRSEPDARPADT